MKRQLKNKKTGHFKQRPASASYIEMSYSLYNRETSSGVSSLL